MEENREAYSRIDSETRDMLEVVAHVRIPERCHVAEEGEERYNMCNAFEDMRQEGYEEGVEKGIRILIQAYQELGMSQDIIMEKCAEKFEIEKEQIVHYL